MKKYIKPNTDIVMLDIQSLLNGNSVTSVTGADGLDKGDGDFGGGSADSRRGNSIWDDED